MPAATQVITSFLGGEISQFAQGRYDRPDYRMSLRTCINAFPVEIGPWTRRPGTQYAGHTKGGAPGRTVKFDFQQSASVTIEFTDGWLRFRSGVSFIPTNDPVAVLGISTANPAVLHVNASVQWQTGNTIFFTGPAPKLLQSRQLTVTRIDGTHFSLADALTGAGINGAGLELVGTGCVAFRIQEVSTPYAGGSWANIRVVQAEKTSIFLNGKIAPQALTVTPPSAATGSNPVFELSPVVFQDGPYLDPFTNGVQATPSAKTGIVALTLSFQTYSSTIAYTVGSFVTYSGNNYESLLDQNVNHQPDVSPTFWQVVPVGAAINDGAGFLGSDTGRLVRLLSEPPPWNVSTAYASAGTVVSYNPSGIPGATTYWQSLAATTGNPPGSDLTHWQIIPQGAAIWSWGKITGFSNIIDPALAGSVSIGDMTGGGGTNSVFNGAFSQPSTAGAAHGSINNVTLPPRAPVGLSCFVGKDYSGASAQAIQQVSVYPTTDVGFSTGNYLIGGTGYPFSPQIVLNLRASSTPPANSSDGNILGSSGPIGNSFSAITIVSIDQATTWNYVWVEMAVTALTGFGVSTFWSLENTIAQVSFFSPTGTSASTGVNIEILGPALLYTNPITTWRLGLYSGTTGWPTCGVYNDGRLYLGGALGNRFDASVSNGIDGGTINFAPTDQYGAVAASNAIAYKFNSDSVNNIEWMVPDLQGIIMGTQAGEWLVQAPTAGPISPTNITARNVTHHGSANVMPCRTEHTTIFVQRYAKKLLEYFPDVYSGKFSAPNLADKAQHIVRAGVAELAYASAATPIVWGRDTAGNLFGVTYKRDSLSSSQPATFYGWHRHRLGSGRVVESICSGPSVGGNLDTLTMVTNDTTNSIRHVEILTDTPDEMSPFANSWFLDDAISPSSYEISYPDGTHPFGFLKLNGLWHLNGKTVQVFAGGLDCGDTGEGAYTDFVVSNGSVSIEFGDGVSTGSGRGLLTPDFMYTISITQIVVGFTYNSDGQIVRLIAQADTGARNGPALGAPSRAHRAALKFVNSKGVSIGGNFTDRLMPCLFHASVNSPRDLPVLSTYTGIFFDQVKDDFTYDDSLCWRVSRPVPATVTAVAVNLRTEDM